MGRCHNPDVIDLEKYRRGDAQSFAAPCETPSTKDARDIPAIMCIEL